MVFLTTSEPPGSSQSYYATRRSPFIAMNDSEVVRYDSSITPVYSEHDARISGVPSDAQRAADQYRLQNSASIAELSAASNNIAERSSSCSRAVQTQRQKKANAIEYVTEEYIPPQYEYHIPSKKTQMEMAYDTARAQSDVARYNSEIAPVYSEHDARISGMSSEAQRASEQFRLQNLTDNTERSSSSRREVQSSIDKELVGRSSSCSRAVQTSNRQRGDTIEYIKHGDNKREYVIEELIPPQYEYHIPSKKTQMELMTWEDNADAGLAQSVSPRAVSQSQLMQIPREPRLHYFNVPLSLSQYLSWLETKEPTYYDNRRAMFFEPHSSGLKNYTFKIMSPDTYDAEQSSLYDNAVVIRARSALARARSQSREHAQENVIYQDLRDLMHNIYNTRRALVPFDRSQSVPPAQQEYKSQWIKIPGGPEAAATVYPTISSSDPRTWNTSPVQEPLQITNYDACKGVDSSFSHVHNEVCRSSSHKKNSGPEFITYEHIPKPDLSGEKKIIAVDQRFDRGHACNHGNDYRSKWVKIARGPSAYIYSSLHSRNKDMFNDPALTGYVGSGDYRDTSAKYGNKERSKYTQTSDSSYGVNQSTSKVNRILNTKEDFEKKHFVDMLFAVQHLLKERQALGAYELPLRMKSKVNYLTKAIHDISKENKSRKYGSHPIESVKSLVSFSSLLSPIRPDMGRTNATTRYQYMLHGPRVFRIL